MTVDLGKNIRYSLTYVTSNPSPGDKSGPWTHVGTYQSTTVAHREALLLANQGYSVWVAGNTAAPKQVWRMGQPSGSTGKGGAGGGGTMGGSGGYAAGTAAAAVQAGMPSYTGGGPSFSIGNVTESIILQQRDDEFLGVDTLTPPEKIAAGYSPDAVNWDGFARIGSRCVRRGCAQFEDDHASLGKNAALRGVSLALIPNGAKDQLQMLYSFADAAIGATRASVATDITVVTTAPRWGKPATLKGWKGPLLAVTDNGSQEIQVDVSYTNIFASAQSGMLANSVVGVTVRYSTVGYPRDIDGYDYLHDKETPASAFTNYDRAAWKGAAAVITQTLVAGKIYVTAWALTREGISEPSFATLTLA